MPSSPPSDRATVRYKGRGHYDRELIDSILDEGEVCSLGVVQPDGSPMVLPTLYARDGDVVYVHGSPASRLLRTAKKDGIPVCFTVMILDGYVMARSAFHHSINYRSVVVFADAVEVRDPEEKRRALARLVDQIHPGRNDECRPPNDKELQATIVLRIPLDEASAKVRTGPPLDDEEDLDLPYRAGVIPLLTRREAWVDC